MILGGVAGCLTGFSVFDYLSFFYPEVCIYAHLPADRWKLFDIPLGCTDDYLGSSRLLCPRFRPSSPFWDYFLSLPHSCFSEFIPRARFPAPRYVVSYLQLFICSRHQTSRARRIIRFELLAGGLKSERTFQILLPLSLLPHSATLLKPTLSCT